MAKEQAQVSGLQQLKMALREKQTARLYIFHGEEMFLLHHYLGQLKKQLVDELTESFNYHKLTKENFLFQNKFNRLPFAPRKLTQVLLLISRSFAIGPISCVG